jgi:phosphodiesterase/alkaline phosphatase D-like protein
MCYRTHDAKIDSWAGFEKEKAMLLDALHTVPNVVILSGDRHEAAGTFAPSSLSVMYSV